MPTTGPHHVQTGADDSSVGTVAWTNATSIVSSNDASASVAFVLGETSHYLKGTNPNPSTIPDAATVTAITLGVERRVDSLGVDPVQDSSVRLVIEGTITGDNKASGSSWPTSDARVEYNWTSLNYTGAQVKASTSGAVLSAVCSGQNTAFVDAMDMTYTYLDPQSQAPRTMHQARLRRKLV